MSWDRIIQDSDDEEILIEDDFPTSTDPLQGHNYSPTQENQPVEYQTDYPIEPSHNASQQLSVNFDQFLQSQEGFEPITASQQRLEARWIPSVNEGGAESIGPMMREIGMAQQKLFDDVGSSAGHLPSTTPYPSEISQPGSFPTTQNYQIQPTIQMASSFNVILNHAIDPFREGGDTQLIESVHAHQAYDYSIPATSNSIASPLGATSEKMTTTYTHVNLNSGTNYLQKPLEQSKTFNPTMNSPHDTEPSSSVASPLKRSKSHNGSPGTICPHSPGGLHDELSMPVVVVEVSSVKKGRGRPRKQAIPQDDDDDELAMTVSPEVPANGAAEPAVVVPPSRKNNALELPQEPDKEHEKAPKAPRKKGVKRSKTASAVLEKSRKEVIDDDVIWVESRPLEEITNNTEAAESENPTPSIPATISSVPATIEAKPPPKKRGRKRKTADVTEPEPAQAPEEQTTAPAAIQASILIENTESKQETKSTSNYQTSQPELTALTKSSELPPQTPLEQSTNESGTGTTRKVPSKYSPIMSTSKVPYRVGLSRNARIAPLLKMVRK
ncbi:hypothetical protein N7495_006436 [Penicillium taxi]|uniref:uncharacterized protein n=1 Tax=Penicillium taxi TaxID=168475 RepID=UPI002544E487|nr:uncharacterized protein N7495_006436 [Penicillium taxi]KAJ5894745.1 hypothetical protein N7495_006436 [Penicillium taxi]